MIIAYIAHPISGNVPANLEDLRRINRLVNENYPNVVPFMPYYADCISLDDSIPAERERGIANDKAIFESGIIEELWITGDRISAGMIEEIVLAATKGITIVDKRSEFLIKTQTVENNIDDLPF